MESGAYTRCAEACNSCADACDRCLSACLLEFDKGEMAHCVALDLECAATCRLLAGFASRGSTFAPQLAGFCSTMCAACQQECSKHSHDHCQRCAEACRRAMDALQGLMVLEESRGEVAEGSDAPIA